MNALTEIIDRCLAGDRFAQQQLYKDHYGLAMSVCLRYCKTKEEASEVVNDGFLKVFQNLSRFDSRQPFKNWFKRILINASIDFYRNQNKHYYHQDIDTAWSVKSDSPSSESNLLVTDLMRLVESLPITYKTSFCLFAIDGYSHQEIAETMGISVGTSKSNVSRARQMLRERLEKSEQQTATMKSK